jgi:FkbM family methyltransferase
MAEMNIRGSYIAKKGQDSPGGVVMSIAKQLSISLGLYKSARAIHRALSPSERTEFQSYKSLLAQFISLGDLTFDVGANIGNRTEAMLALGARVVAFEPQAVCAREIRARGNKHLTVVESAVGAETGSADMHVKTANTQSSLLPNWQGDDAGIVRVPVTTLDAEIERFGLPVYCKIDVEGYEVPVFKGLSTPIKFLSFEFQCDEIGIEKVRTCLELIGKLGSYEVNLTGQDNARWLLQKWVTIEEMVAIFPSCALDNFWGDIFLRH